MRLLRRIFGPGSGSADGAGSGAAIMAGNYVQGPAAGGSTDNALVRWDGTTGRLVQNSANGPYATDAGLLGLATTAPTHSVTVASSAVATAVGLYNTADQTTNYERLALRFAANRAEIAMETAGTGTVRDLRLMTSNGTSALNLGVSGIVTIVGGAAQIRPSSSVTMSVFGAITTHASTGGVVLGQLNNLSASSGIQTPVVVSATVAQSSTAGYKALQVNITESSTGSGQKDLLSLEIGGSQRARVGNDGNLFSSMGTAIPAGGAAGTGLFVSSTSGFGVYYGSGAPSVSAAKGSLYLRSDGSGVNDRMYVNTDGGTTWTAVVTVA